MTDAPESEAIAILAKPLFCEDVPGWAHNRLKPDMVSFECGLMQEDRSRAGLHVQLVFARSQKTKIATFKFSVFRMSLGSPQRIYQIEVKATAYAPKNWHDLAHEHMGDARTNGSQEWLKWTFKEALDYFCKRANITFIPPLSDPEAFELKP
jgi:hypothetical protein